MNAVFVDTSFLIALLRTKDRSHERAMTWAKCLSGSPVIVEYVRVGSITTADCNVPGVYTGFR